MAFERTITPRFHEVDRAGIVFFGRIFEYCHIVYEELMTATLGDWTTAFENGGWGTPLVHAEADFKRPMQLGVPLTVSAVVERLDASSVTYVYELRDPDGALCATARLVHGSVEMGGFTPCPVPVDFVDGLRRLDLLPGE